MANERDEQAIWLNGDAFFQKTREQGGYASIIAFDLVMLFCAAGHPVDVSDPKALLEKYAKVFPNRPPTLAKWRKLKPQIREFFVEVKPDLWAPSPEYFVYNDPQSEQT